MPNRIPPEWYNFIVYIIAGALGALVRGINTADSATKIFLEMLCGAVCAIYCGNLVAEVLYHILVKTDLIQPQNLVPERLLGFSGFLCGVGGIRLITAIAEMVKKHLR